MKTTSKAQVRMQKATAAICAAAMVASMLPCAASAEPGEVAAATQEKIATVQDAAQLAATGDIASGTSGTCTWTINSAGTLTVSPTTGNTGELGTWSTASEVPWYSYDTQITSARFTGKVKAQTCFDLFYGCSSLTSLDLSGLDTSSVTNMGCMFYFCESLTSLDLSGLDTSKVTDMRSVFYGCSSLTSVNLSGLDTSSATIMASMFNGCYALTSLDLSSFNTSSVTDMQLMFSTCVSLTSLDLSSFDTSVVTNMATMFSTCKSLNSLDLSSFDTSSVTDMYCMFDYCQSLTFLDLSSFDTSSVKDMGHMFWGCSLLDTIEVGAGWSTAAVLDSEEMFSDCTSLVGGKGTMYDSAHVDVTYARMDGGPGSDTPGYLTEALRLEASCAPADKCEKATVTATLTGADAATYRFYYSADGGATWKQAARNTTGIATITANPTNAARQWKVVAIAADSRIAEATFKVVINDPMVETSTTPAAKYNTKATVNVYASHFGAYCPAKYKYYYSADNGDTWKQVAYHNKQYTETDSLQVTANATNAKRLWKVVVTFKDGRTAEAPFTVTYA